MELARLHFMSVMDLLKNGGPVNFELLDISNVSKFTCSHFFNRVVKVSIAIISLVSSTQILLYFLTIVIYLWIQMKTKLT